MPENTIVWNKSSHSGEKNCVEVGRGFTDGSIGVRDTKDNGTGPVLKFTPGEWDAFVSGVRDGEFG